MNPTVITQTGFDFKNPKLLADVIAPELATRLQGVIPGFGDAKQVVGAMLNTYKALTGAVTVTGAVGAMVAAVQGARSWLDGRVEASYSDSLANLENARNAFVTRYYDPSMSGWSQVLRTKAPNVPDVKDEVGGWSPEQFLQQYDPDFVFFVEKVGRNVLAPTWPTPPMDSPASLPEYWCGGAKSPGERALLGGFGKVWDPGHGLKKGDEGAIILQGAQWGNLEGTVDPLNRRGFIRSRPDIPAMSECGVFWGNAPGSGSLFANKYDTTIFESGYGIPPGYAYLFSWGTYPYLSWGTSSNDMGSAAAKYAHSAAAAALAATIHAPTAIHAAVRTSDVARAYQHWQAATQMRRLPPIPAAQPENGVYLDAELLPWAPTGGQTLPRVADWQDAKIGGWSPIPVQVARDIELAFRSFFRVRRALIYQIDLVTADVRAAAKLSTDPALAAAAMFGAPQTSVAEWSAADPLAEGWVNPWKTANGISTQSGVPNAPGTSQSPGGPPTVPKNPGTGPVFPADTQPAPGLPLGGTSSASSADDGPGTALAVAGGLAALAYWRWKAKR